MALTNQRAIAADRPATALPTVWHHPHVRGALVVEQVDGRLFLVFVHYGVEAWARRCPWRGGMAMLLPASAESPSLLAALGCPGPG